MCEPYWHGRGPDEDDFDEKQARYEEQEEMRRDYLADMDAFDKAMENYEGNDEK